MLNIQRVAQYARFSSDNQRSESIDAQIRAMNQYCKQQHWQTVATYTDEARSATSDNRPQFQKMIQDSEKGAFDIVLVHKLDRFSRDRYDSAIYKKRLKKNNVKLCSVLERIDDSPESIMMESVLEGMAEYYSKNLGREVMKGLKENAIKCKHNGGCPPLGYELDESKRLIINPHEAEAVKIIYEMFAEGYGYDRIINYLNEQGYTTKKGLMFRKNSLYEILRNEKYTGIFVFNKLAPMVNGHRNNHAYNPTDKMIRVEGGCPQIIDKELFDKVQEIRAKNKRNTGSYHGKEFYLLTGKVFCGVCGRRLQGNMRYCKRNGTKFVSYRCDSHRSECDNKEYQKEYLDRYIVELLEDKLLNKAALKKAVANVNKQIKLYNKNHDANHDRVLKEYNDVLKNLSNLTQAIERGIFTEDIIKRAEQLETERTRLEGELQGAKMLEPVTFTDVSHILTQWQSLAPETPEYRNFIQQFIKEIRTYPYHFDVVLDMGLGVVDVTETVSLRRGELYEKYREKFKERDVNV